MNTLNTETQERSRAEIAADFANPGPPNQPMTLKEYHDFLAQCDIEDVTEEACYMYREDAIERMVERYKKQLESESAADIDYKVWSYDEYLTEIFRSMSHEEIREMERAALEPNSSVKIITATNSYGITSMCAEFVKGD